MQQAEDLDVIAPLQHRVQQRLGRCILRLQQYERLLKVLVGTADIRGKPHELETARARPLDATQRSTLGLLVGAFTSTVLKPDGHTWSDDTPPTEFRMRQVIEMTSEDLEGLRASLKSLVELRNELVHHFVERFDIWTSEGCHAAESHLSTSFETIDRHVAELVEIAKAMDAARQEALAFVNSQAFEDMMFDGIRPDGSVDWPRAGIVQALREAEHHLQHEGWTDLNAAIVWIRKHYPRHYPKRYQCASWRHVIHRSNAFEARRLPETEFRTLNKSSESVDESAPNQGTRAPRDSQPKA